MDFGQRGRVKCFILLRSIRDVKRTHKQTKELYNIYFVIIKTIEFGHSQITIIGMLITVKIEVPQSLRLLGIFFFKSSLVHK